MEITAEMHHRGPTDQFDGASKTRYTRVCTRETFISVRGFQEIGSRRWLAGM